MHDLRDPSELIEAFREARGSARLLLFLSPS